MMKKILLSVFLCLAVFAFAQDAKVMVIADPHVMVASLGENGAAYDQMMSQQRKMLHLSQVAFTSLVDTALLHNPALVLIPGDLTKDGELESHNFVAQQIKRLNEAGIKVLVIPGNHDIEGNALAYSGSEAKSVANLKNTEWKSKYAMVYNLATATDPNSHSYVAEPITGVTVLGIDASHGTGEGSLSDATLSWVLSQADAANQKGNMVIAMCHWQLLEHVDNSGLILESARLQNADAVRDALMKHGVNFVLTGHMHINSISTYRDTVSAASVDSIVEVSTGSPITYPSPYRWLTISKDRSNIGIETECLTTLPGYTNFATYSRDWMAEHSKVMIPSAAIRLFGYMEVALNEYIDAEIGGVVGGMVKGYLKSCLPQKDEEKISLARKHVEKAYIDLYLLHSDANEFARPESKTVAQSVYTALTAMVDDMVGSNALLKGYIEQFTDAVVGSARVSVQSLVEDRTHWTSTNYSDCTDDLQLIVTINEPMDTPVDNILVPNANTGLYDIMGRPVLEGQAQPGHVYIQNGKKILF